MTGHLLAELLLVLAIAAVGVALFERVGLPAVAGFLVMGVIVGPGGLGVVGDLDRVRAIAELGVVFLLFEIGIELPIERIRRLWRDAAGAGALQVVVTVAGVAALARALGAPWAGALVIGAVIAMSSTALVLDVLRGRGELDAPHGQLSLGILLFQDLCIVPFLLAVPILAGTAGGSATEVALAIGRAALALAALYVGGRFLVPRLLERVARLGSRDLFSLVAVLVVVGSAVVAERLGLTLAVGAFIGGIVAASSPYAYQLFSELVPLRGVLLGLFFTAVGMLLDPGAALERAPDVLLYVALVVVGKAAIVALVVGNVLRRGLRTAVSTGLGLAQTGEFSFVLAAAAAAAGILPEAFATVFVAGSVVTLVATPFLVRSAPKVAGWLARDGGGDAPAHALPAASLQGHALVIGYGVAGQNVVRVLRSLDVPYAILEANPRSVALAQKGHERIVFGDATRASMLSKLGIATARLVIVAISDPVATREVTALARRLAPETPVLVKTRYKLEIDDLSAAGASVVISEELEATVDLVAAVLRVCGLAEGPIEHFARELRQEGYQALRQPAAMAIDPWLAEILREVPTDWVEVPDEFRGEATLEALGVRARTGANVLAVERAGVAHPGPPPGFALRAGDRLLVFGTAESAARLMELLVGHGPDGP